MRHNKKTIHPGYLDGTKKNQNNDLNFPSIRKPTFLAWREWKAFIFRNFLSGRYIITPPLNMKQYNQHSQIPTNEIEKLQMHTPSTYSLHETIQTLPKELRCIICKLVLPDDNGLSLVKSLQNGTLIGACDGSVITNNKRTWGDTHTHYKIGTHIWEGLLGIVPLP